MIIIIVLGLIFGGIAASVAGKKGRSKILWFIASFLLGGIPLLILLFMSNLKGIAEQEMLASTKQCPKCAERIKQEANVCRYCNYEFA